MAEPAGVPVATLAKLFNLTPRRVWQLAREGIIPRGARGRYDLVACVQAYVRHLQNASRGRAPADTAKDLAAERLKKIKGENALRDGTMIPQDVVADGAGEVIAVLAGRLRALESRLDAELDGVTNRLERRRTIRREIRAAQDEAAAGLHTLADGIDRQGTG